MTSEENLTDEGQNAKEVASENNRSGLKVKTGLRAGEDEDTWVATKTG